MKEKLKKKLGRGWQQVAWDRSEWDKQGVAYVQEWTGKADEEEEKYIFVKLLARFPGLVITVLKATALF